MAGDSQSPSVLGVVTLDIVGLSILQHLLSKLKSRPAVSM
jgi:hypothetical protein